jgi:hypothetical protein
VVNLVIPIHSFLFQFRAFLSNPNYESQLCACTFDFKQWIVMIEPRIEENKKIESNYVKPVMEAGPLVYQ